MIPMQIKGFFINIPVDGTNQMQKVSAGKEAATPGAVMASQVPAKTVQVPADTIAQRLKI